jgi:hypothetical protein
MSTNGPKLGDAASLYVVCFQKFTGAAFSQQPVAIPRDGGFGLLGYQLISIYLKLLRHLCRWNFTPSPGWTTEEARILKLCLLKYGVGKWVQILDTGLLPGKMIQQLNGQTQRLLGQQSLAAYTGLRVDVDRIRADNEARTDLTRKAGLIIHDGDKLTKEQKMALQEESKAKYGLTDEQMLAVDKALEEIYGTRIKDDKEVMRHRELLSGILEGFVVNRPSRETLDGLSREEKIDRLRELHGKLELAQQVYKYHVSRQCQQTFQRKHKSDNKKDVYVPMGGAGEDKEKKTTKRKTANKSKKFNTNGGKTKKAKDIDFMDIISDEDDDPVDEGRCDKSVAQECRDAGIDASISTLVAMGFGRRQAMDALEETNGSVEGAVEWLMVNCVR